jgi:hypothetical protein
LEGTLNRNVSIAFFFGTGIFSDLIPQTSGVYCIFLRKLIGSVYLINCVYGKCVGGFGTYRGNM